MGAHDMAGRRGSGIAPAGWKVAVSRDASALAGLLPQWEDLAAHALEPNPFYESWSLLPALEAEPARRERLFVQVWKQGRLDGLFPFVREPRFKGLPLSALRSWHHASHMLCTPLVRAGAQAGCLQALLAWLGEGGGGAAAAEFRFLPADGAFIGALADATRDAPVTAASTAHFTRALLRRQPDAERWLVETLSSDARKTMRRRERRLRERGEVSHVALKPGDDGARWIAEFLALEASGWKGRAGSALASTPGNLRFASGMLAEAHRRGRLQIVGIDCEGRPISRCCNLIAGEGSYAWRTAYDERYAEYSPGVMAELESMRAFHALPGVAWMDSITDPGNAMLNRLWPDRRTMQSVLLGFGSWGEMWVSMLPMMRWAARRVKAAAGSVGFYRSGDSLNGKAPTIPSEI